MDGNKNHDERPVVDPDVIELGHVAGKRKRSLESEHPVDSGHDEVFFRISHTQLGRHKLFDKGAVATYDFGVQVIPTLECQPESAHLDMSEAGVTDNTNLTKLATWMSESNVSGEQLRTCWKVWCAGPPEGQAGFQSTYLWNLRALDLALLIPDCQGDALALSMQFLEK